MKGADPVKISKFPAELVTHSLFHTQIIWVLDYADQTTSNVYWPIFFNRKIGSKLTHHISMYIALLTISYQVLIIYILQIYHAKSFKMRYVTSLSQYVNHKNALKSQYYYPDQFLSFVALSRIFYQSLTSYCKFIMPKALK